MNWTQYIDGYCERVDPGFWAEPVNALTNAAFLIAAYVMWRRVRGQGTPLAMLLVLILAAIGVGSFLFHTFATVWASVADVTPIGLFILTYLYIANREFAGWPVWVSLLGVVGFLPYAAGLTAILSDIPFFQISNFYWTVPILIYVYAFFLRKSAPETARGMVIGATILVASITIRSLDIPVCDGFPLGVHFLWHVLNGIMLGWMIEVYRRHRVSGGLAGGPDQR